MKITSPGRFALIGMVWFFAACATGPRESPGETQKIASSTKTTILVTYYSRGGSTKKLAEAIVEGAASVENTEVVLKPVAEVGADDLLGCDGIIVGSPVYYANMAHEVKEFFDNWTLKFGIYPENKMAFKPGAAFASGFWASGGKEMVINSINAAFLNSAMIVVAGEKGAGASATGEFKEEGRQTDLERFEYQDGFALGRRVAMVAAALKTCLLKVETPASRG